MSELNKYLQDLQDEGIIHREVKSHIMHLAKVAIDELYDEIPWQFKAPLEDDISGGMRNCGDVD